ncbi:UDP-2,4-diacetamido-2,4,6-trideoxy-beta-L-altropyranose hydrolase [Thioalkalivibrio sp. ALE31]|uniref:UDP-2,4-diacetamido-2,4, 6-trideoxy-beta-L-altropyranose hydrolase n=1 Tax=Thioalkalivibrio sp. ALE31 TaxID=1158182 RepID=UPI0009DA0806|nr:UDP-2,4-diacetamido-2,4,6-trideoxy-beta-L-altropyranose hydrolase [Thioalkalivibrio sp. ALE31]
MIIFRCDAGPDIGFGHLMRCRTLAEALHDRGESCIMVGPDAVYAKPEDKKIFKEWIPVPEWQSSSADSGRLVSLSQKYRAQWLVLDDYRVDEAYQLELRAAGLKWLQFDGWADKPLWADIILNANPAAASEDYERVLHNKDAKILLGPSYGILRKEFAQIEPRDPSRPVRQILVTFGGGDDRGANEFVLSTLLPVVSPDVNFLVISGATNPNNPSLGRWIEEHGKGRVSLHIDPIKVAPLFASCDLAVMAGGTSTYEAAACGIPMILIAIAANQVPQSMAWSRFGAANYLGSITNLCASKLSDEVCSLSDNLAELEMMSESGKSAVQGGGASAVAAAMSEEG